MEYSEFEGTHKDHWVQLKETAYTGIEPMTLAF